MILLLTILAALSQAQVIRSSGFGQAVSGSSATFTNCIQTPASGGVFNANCGTSNVGIGTPNPAGPLHVQGLAISSTVYVGNGATTANTTYGSLAAIHAGTDLNLDIRNASGIMVFESQNDSGGAYTAMKIDSSNLLIQKGSSAQTTFGGSVTVAGSSLTVGGIITSSTTSPTITCSAGTGILEAQSTSHSGTFAAGAAATSCTITFTQTWPKTPNCTVTDDTSLVPIRVSARSTSAITIAGTTISGDTITYICMGAP